MRFPLNLASEPFRRDRPVFAASVALAAILLALLATQTVLIFMQRNQAAESRAAIEALETRMRALDAEQAKVNQAIRRPENAAVIDSTVFLNLLLQRKGVSWTRIFADLEGVVPHNVRVVSVRPQITTGNQILLDLIVASQETPAVIDMLMRLEASPIFGKTAIANWLPPSQSEPLYRYRLTVNYAQKL
jgi:Tfp pilus assembly protein PilN